MLAEWRSSDVTLLVESIENEKAYDRLSILADALEEAGCDDAALLSACRNPADTRLHDGRLRRIIDGEVTLKEIDEALKFLTEIAKNAHTADYYYGFGDPARPGKPLAWLLGVTEKYLDSDGEEQVEMDWSSLNELEEAKEAFWQHYCALTGRVKPKDVSGVYNWNPYQCPC